MSEMQAGKGSVQSGMTKKIVAVNASPRKNWNTGQLVRAAAEGAGAEVIDLYTLERFTGCISCFGCKTEKFAGQCVCNDALKPVLDAIRSADGLIIGTPNYLGEASASFRALYERLIFQYLTYNPEHISANTRQIPVLFIMTSNAGDAAYEPGGFYHALVENYRNTLTKFVGPAKVLIAADTVQVSDYSRYNWKMFDGEAKQRRHDAVFAGLLDEARALGKEMAEA